MPWARKFIFVIQVHLEGIGLYVSFVYEGHRAKSQDHRSKKPVTFWCYWHCSFIATSEWGVVILPVCRFNILRIA